MDQTKIGRLIALCRKEKELTQMQLAEMLGITDKAVSKWERGIAMPDTALMLPLCEILGISVNELLKGEKKMENETQSNEELLLSMAREIEQKNKTIWKSMWVIMIASIASLLLGMFLISSFVPGGVWQVVLILVLCALFMIPCLYALKLEVSVGAYRCGNCGNEFVPTYKEALKAMHRGFTRHLKCPQCEQKSWCKKIIKK